MVHPVTTNIRAEQIAHLERIQEQITPRVLTDAEKVARVRSILLNDGRGWQGVACAMLEEIEKVVS